MTIDAQQYFKLKKLSTNVVIIEYKNGLAVTIIGFEAIQYRRIEPFRPTNT